MTENQGPLRAIQRVLDRYQRAGTLRYTKINPGGMMRRGLPDLLGCYRGRCFAIEVKGPDGRVSKAQQHEFVQWAATGAWAVIAHDAGAVQEVLDMIDEMIDGKRAA